MVAKTGRIFTSRIRRARAFAAGVAIAALPWFLGAEKPDPMPDPMIDKLDPTTRTQVLMALLGIVLAGLTLVTLIVVGARYVRRLGVARTPTPTHQDEWYKKPLTPESDPTEDD